MPAVLERRELERLEVEGEPLLEFDARSVRDERLGRVHDDPLDPGPNLGLRWRVTELALQLRYRLRP
jgi:hypothetical protein